MTAFTVLVISGLVVGLMAMSTATVVILRVQADREQLRTRIINTVRPHQRRQVAGTFSVGSGVGLTTSDQRLGIAAARLFGFDPGAPDHYVLSWWAALIATLIVTIILAKLLSGLVGSAVWIASPVAWVVLSRGFFNWCETRRRNKLFNQFPDALAMIVRGVRVGIPVADSIRAVGRELSAPTSSEFTRLSQEIAIGMVLEDALKVMAERNGLQEYRFFATALSLQNQTGGGLSETLETLADVIRKRVAVREKGHALAAEAKMSSMVLAALPPLAAVGLWIMNSSYIILLFVDPLGQKILAGAFMALSMGIATMKFLISKSLA